MAGMKMPKGIVSPWARTEEAGKEQPGPPPLWKTEEDMVTPDRDTVRFPGRTRSIHLRPLHGKEAPDVRGRAALGRALADLLAKVPESRTVFTKQSLGFTPPLRVHIVLDLGGVPFYAGTSTAEPETARKMAVDRIAHALTECVVRYPKAKDLLDKHFVRISNT